MNNKNFLRTQETIFELAKDRGYSTENVEKWESFEDDCELVFDDLLVIWHNDQIGIKYINTLLSGRLKDGDIKNVIIIRTGKLTSNAKTTIQELNYISDESSDKEKKHINIQTFEYKQLIINITKHMYQPKFRRVTEKEEKNILQQYRTTKEFLPKILSEDPVCEYYNWKKGDIIEMKDEDGITYACIDDK